MRLSYTLSALFVYMALLLSSQTPTVGLTYSTAQVSEAYTLFAPIASKQVYLINTCGEKVHEWSTDYYPGLGMRIKSDGSIVRSGRIPNATFGGGGGNGGILQTIDWNGNVLWTYSYSTPAHVQHHDICILPNGHVLISTWEVKTAAKAIAAGKNPALVPTTGVWTEQILELEPVGTDSAIIVWKWDVWDHLIQDEDSTKNNYGVVADHPEKINANYSAGLSNDNWVHINAIDYNPATDQVMVSSRLFSEIWIIDHSTTTAEAATTSGGQCGKGGDLLFRYGNPEAYGRGDSSNRKLYFQHDAHWIKSGSKYAGSIIVFNNGVNRPDGNYSSVDIIAPDLSAPCNYSLMPDSTYKAATLWVYNQHNEQNDLYSHHISGADILPDGHVRICSGTEGRFFEVDSNKQKTWEYVSPVTINGILSQGSVPALNGNSVFKTESLLPDDAALSGNTLTPQGVIEANPYPSVCVSGWQEPAYTYFALFPNPATSTIRVNTGTTAVGRLMLTDAAGRICQSQQLSVASTVLDLHDLPAGVYFLVWQPASGNKQVMRFVKTEP